MPTYDVIKSLQPTVSLALVLMSAVGDIATSSYSYGRYSHSSVCDAGRTLVKWGESKAAPKPGVTNLRHACPRVSLSGTHKVTIYCT